MENKLLFLTPNKGYKLYGYKHKNSRDKYFV